MNILRNGQWPLAGIGVLLLASGYFLWDVFRDRIVDPGDRAPEFSITTESGKRITAKDFGGKVLVLNFWATWCPPCIEEIPSLNQFARDHRDKGVVVLGVSVDKSDKAYRRFLGAMPMTFETAHDPAAGISGEYGTFMYPETYIINKDGVVVEKLIGGKDWTNPDVIRNIRALL
jgi:cytochrome c biogenesis protein CcmG, thiol:disulfide interchange protein DsbE